MYKFHYDYALKTFDTKLSFTYTDSLVYEIKDFNVDKQCFKDKHYLILVDTQKIMPIMMVQTKSIRKDEKSF